MIRRREEVSSEPVLLSPEQIALRRIPIEDAELNLAKRSNWHCSYCDRRFSGEGTFMKHHCEPRRRQQELKSPIGQAALSYYRAWMHCKRFSQPGAEAFLESKFYRTFIKFAEMVQAANIAKPEKYIEIMVENDLNPTLWCRDSAYAWYLDWSDKLSDPLDQVQASVEYLMDLSEKEGVKLSDIFNHLGSQQVLSLIRQRRLSPWLLFCSPTFGALLKTLDQSQLQVFNQVVNAGYWGERFKTEKATIENVKQIVKAVGL